MKQIFLQQENLSFLTIAKKDRIPLGFTATVAKIEALANFEIAPLDLDVLKIAESIAAHWKCTIN